MQPFISEQFNGIIWRMEIDVLTDTIVVEVRNNEEKKVSFSAINLRSGTTYFKHLDTPERWLTGIEAAYEGVLLLHYYQSETSPTHKGFMAVDIITAKTLWSNYNFAFDHLSVDGPILYDSRLQPRKLFLVDIKTGTTTRVYEPLINKELKNNIKLPDIITQDELFEKGINFHSFGNMAHYLEYNNFRIVSLHALKGGQLTQSLYIINGTDTVYEDLLNHNIQKIQPEAFILHNNYLIYIKNKSELKVLAL